MSERRIQKPEGVAGQREEKQVWCQTRNSRRLSSFRVEWTALGVSACVYVRARVCVCLCEIFGNHKTKLGGGDVTKT